jgi:hypothetical protein
VQRSLQPIRCAKPVHREWLKQPSSITESPSSTGALHSTGTTCSRNVPRATQGRVHRKEAAGMTGRAGGSKTSGIAFVRRHASRVYASAN